ncbi:hypothetical protein CISIN_1g041862mg [Citrus sinensis]|uniref:Uncharacterized protein n=1 Tax=Citrus sinensis TaxID=2711 RepID=A0A067ES37_CITSI|nr:hypothetical protein CISIN_1g041862mg [Citrus sinensis]
MDNSSRVLLHIYSVSRKTNCLRKRTWQLTTCISSVDDISSSNTPPKKKMFESGMLVKSHTIYSLINSYITRANTIG